jgi:Fe/S biogenesis protein NfuA
VTTVPDSEPLLSITDAALAKLREFRDAHPAPEDRCLYVRVSDVHDGEYRPALSLEPSQIAEPGDRRERVGDLEVVVAQGSADRMRGATIDWWDDPSGSGFVVENPNRPSVDDALQERVREVLERDVNPGIALHGGRADLVAVEGRTVYVRLSGGCQGCGMASATLTQGIEVMLTEALPQIADVVDVTDHASGTNPYYAPA